jgi:hypothetical protein
MKNLFYACTLEIGEAMRRSDLRAVGDSHSLFWATRAHAGVYIMPEQEKAAAVYNLLETLY